MMVSTDCLVCPRPRLNAVTRMFCVPPAGAGASAYRGWAENLDRQIDVCYVQLPGRENRFHETPFSAIEPLADALATDLTRSLDRPYVFYGHSLGATIAFETIRALRRRGFYEPHHLFVSAGRAPHLAWPHSPIRHLSGVQLLREVNRRYESVPAAIFDDAEIQELVMPALRADLTMLENYTHRAERPLGCGITVIGGRHDRMVERAALDGWRDHTAAEFQLHLLDDGHMFLQTERSRLLEIIASTLSAGVPSGARAGVGRPIDA